MRAGLAPERPAEPTRRSPSDDAGLIGTWLADGRGMLSLTAIGLVVSGIFAWFLALSDQLLPHDLAWLSVAEHELRAVADGRLVDFMAHDRAAFGGTLIAVGVLYLWLIRFPLGHGEAWAWWTLVVTGALGFASFLTYLVTGYLDTWHGVATLAILPPFLLGLYRTRPISGIEAIPWARLRLRRPSHRRSIGRALIVLTGIGMLAAGATILGVGSAVVFVPQDLEFLQLDRTSLEAIDPHLVPLIAHDRIGFGGGLATVGCLVVACAWSAPISRSLWEALLLAGLAGFGSAIGVHGLIGYLDLVHVGPAMLGAAVFAVGMLLSRPGLHRGDEDHDASATVELEGSHDEGLTVPLSFVRPFSRPRSLSATLLHVPLLRIRSRLRRRTESFRRRGLHRE